MREISFDREVEIPIVDVNIRGPRGSYKARLVIDTGCGLTQIDTSVIDFIGYSASDGEKRINISGVTGEVQQGYSVRVARLRFFGLRFENVLIGALDFEHLNQHQIDGLLGFDLIKQLHFELNGPQGIIKIFP